MLREVRHPSGPLREDLVRVPGGRGHDVKHPYNELPGDLAVEQIAHGADKDAPGHFPSQGFGQHLWMAGQDPGPCPIGLRSQSVFGIVGQPAGHCLGVAVASTAW